MSTHATAKSREQWFASSYGALLRHAALPLVALRQTYESGGDTGSWHHEDFYALYLVQSGRGVHVINDHPHAIARGDVYITPPGTSHAYRDYNGLRALAFCFQAPLFACDELEALRSLPGFWHLFVQPDPAQPDPAQPDTSRAVQSKPGRKEIFTRADYHLHLSPEHWREAEDLAVRVETELQNGLTENTLRLETRPLVRGLFFQLLVLLARRHAATRTAIGAAGDAPDGDGATSGGMADVLRFCEAHFASPLSVPQLAARMFLSPGRFSLVFSRQMGMPPAAYIRRLRLERAQHLLRTSSLSTAQIARECGFNDGAQLSRLFRAAFQQTPTAYRNDYGRRGL